MQAFCNDGFGTFEVMITRSQVGDIGKDSCRKKRTPYSSGEPKRLFIRHLGLLSPAEKKERVGNVVACWNGKTEIVGIYVFGALIVV